jgi:hypothetical protein
MTNLQTDPKLLEALEKAVQEPVTAETIRKQRVSFIMGVLGNESTITRERVTEILARHEAGSPAY